MGAKYYELLEHTADTGIRVIAPDIKTLFVNAGLAVFDIIGRRVRITSTVSELPVEVRAEDTKELLVAWLNELLYISSTERVIITAITVEDISGHSLRARVTGEPSESFKIETEIKAATYHQLVLGRSGDGWTAEVIFDV